MARRQRASESLDAALWQTRLRHASRDLASARTMRAVTTLVERVAARREPSLRVVAGGPALRGVRRVLVFPGSFNPLTRAHSALVETALAAGYDAALWLLAAASVDKERVERAALADRVTQMRAYVRGAKANALAVINRGLYYEQARLLHTRFKTAEVTILVGFDKAPQIFDARYYDDRDAALEILFANARLLVAPRADAGRAELAALLARRENQRFAERVTYLDAPARYANDSSTRERRQAAKGADIASLHEYPAEAVALIETGAYAQEPGPDAAEDRYAERLAWLRGLATESDDGGGG